MFRCCSLLKLTSSILHHRGFVRSLAAGPCGTCACDRGSSRLQLVAWAARARSAHPVCAIVQTLQNRSQGLRPLITNIGTRALTFLVAVISTMTARGWGSSSTCATVSLEVPRPGCDDDFPALPRSARSSSPEIRQAALLWCYDCLSIFCDNSGVCRFLLESGARQGARTHFHSDRCAAPDRISVPAPAPKGTRCVQHHQRARLLVHRSRRALQ